MTYHVAYDKLSNRITIRLVGFLNDEEIIDYEKDIEKILSEAEEGFDLFADLSEFKVTADRNHFTRVVKKLSGSPKLRKAAVLRPRSAIGGLQIKHVSKEANTDVIKKRRMFTDRNEALKWINQ